MPAIVKELDHVSEVFCVHTGSPTRQRSPLSFPAFKSCDLKAMQISSMFCSSAGDLICTSRYSSGAKPCTLLTCSLLPCCLPPSPLPRLPELWWAWAAFANTVVCV